MTPTPPKRRAPGAGRPRKPDALQDRITVRVHAAERQALALLGGGNASAGLRRLIEKHLS